MAGNGESCKANRSVLLVQGRVVEVAPAHSNENASAIESTSVISADDSAVSCVRFPGAFARNAHETATNSIGQAATVRMT